MQVPFPTEPVTIVLSDGVERQLRYSVAALRRLKGELGVSIMSGQLGAIDEEELPKIIAAGLVGEKLTPDQIAELIDIRGLKYVMEKFVQAFTDSLPVERPMIAAEPPPAAE